jgi:nicotinic acid phosphoribosyltransferase
LFGLGIKAMGTAAHTTIKVGKNLFSDDLADFTDMAQADDMLLWQIAVAKTGLKAVKKVLSNDNDMDDLRVPMTDDMLLFKIAKKLAVPVAKTGFKVAKGILSDNLADEEEEIDVMSMASAKQLFSVLKGLI